MAPARRDNSTARLIRVSKAIAPNAWKARNERETSETIKIVPSHGQARAHQARVAIAAAVTAAEAIEAEADSEAAAEAEDDKTFGGFRAVAALTRVTKMKGEQYASVPQSLGDPDI